jgi:hypothetical protein
VRHFTKSAILRPNVKAPENVFTVLSRRAVNRAEKH